ncbi:uncharacterized protein LOC141929492 [Strix aluco]|uniref:uncharacterized protein LOC141929492 n=1 Tax=Strix aluco TaxID=111821 RepID=UPI003DA2A4D3
MCGSWRLPRPLRMRGSWPRPVGCTPQCALHMRSSWPRPRSRWLRPPAHAWLLTPPPPAPPPAQLACAATGSAHRPSAAPGSAPPPTLAPPPAHAGTAPAHCASALPGLEDWQLIELRLPRGLGGDVAWAGLEEPPGRAVRLRAVAPPCPGRCWRRSRCEPREQQREGERGRAVRRLAAAGESRDGGGRAVRRDRRQKPLRVGAGRPRSRAGLRSPGFRVLQMMMAVASNTETGMEQRNLASVGISGCRGVTCGTKGDRGGEQSTVRRCEERHRHQRRVE